MRRFLLPLSGLLALLLVAAAALWLWRLPLAEWALARWLEDRGVEGSAQVVRLDLEGAALEALRLDGQRAGHVEVAYELPALLDGRVARVEIAGLRLAADLTAERPLGGLIEAFAGPGDAAPGRLTLPVLPPVALDDARLDLVTARGPLSLRLDGGLEAADGLPEPARRLALELETLEGPIALSGRAEGLYRPGDGAGSRLALSLEATEGPPLSVAAEAALGERELALDLDLEGDAPLLASLAAAPAGLLPEAGRLSLQAEAAVAAAPLRAGDTAALVADPDALRALQASLTLTDAELPGRARGLDLSAGLALTEPADGRRLTLRPLQAEAAALDPAWLQELGLPAPLAAALAGGGRFALRGTGAQGDAPPAVLRLGEDGPALALDVEAELLPAAGGRLDATLGGELRLAGPSGRLDGRLRAGNLSLPGLAELARAEAGWELALDAETTRLTLDAPATLDGLVLAETALGEDWRALAGRPLDLALGGDGGSAGGLALEGGRLRVALPERLALDGGEASLRATLDGSLTLAGDGSLQDSELAVSGLTAEALPTPWGLLRSAELSGRFEGVPQAASGRLEGRVALADLALEGAYEADLEAELALDLAWDGQALTLALAEPGSLALGGFAEPLAPLLGRVELAVSEAVIGLDGTTRVEAAAALAPLPLDLDGRGRADDLSLSAGRLALDLTLAADGTRGTAVAAGLDLRHREAGVALRDARLSAGLGGEETALELAGGRLVSLAEPALFPPLALSGSGSLAGAALDYRLAGRGLDGALRLDATGSQDLDAGRGRLRLALAPLEFAPGGLQPADLSPALAALERASGRLAAEATLRLGGAQAGGLDGTAELALDGLDFSVAGTRVEGLDLTLALDSLDPPASPPGQPFSIARVEAGVPLTDVRGTLELEAEDGTTVIRVGTAEADFLGGTLALDGARLAPAEGDYALTLQVRKVDLERLLALADLQEVSGSGQLSGEIPIRIEKGAVVVEGGALDALSPGTIAFRSEEAKQALASGGESVELMLRALEDFHYEVLRLTLDKPAEGESRVFLKLEGANPEVLDGQPFVLNINLTSNAAPLLAALARGTEISDRLVEELLRNRR